ncbi:MAG: hypothetical protein IT564_00250 [Rhodospirillales bacterium]|nr:hypothetical protein [Rhodospirillales bacterium]
MTVRIRSLAAAAVALIAAACAEVPPSIPAPAPDSGQAALPAARPETPAPADASALVGRNAREVAELLGEPQLKRRDPPAELWQYRAGPCVLDLFLYADRTGGAATVAHVEMRAVPPVGGQIKESARASDDASLSGRARETEASRAECLRALTYASGGG